MIVGRKLDKKENVPSIRYGFDYAPPIQHVKVLITVFSYRTYNGTAVISSGPSGVVLALNPM